MIPAGGICHFFSIRVDSVMSQLLDYSELNIGKMVGSGGFGTVHKATWRGLPVAVKVLLSLKMNVIILAYTGQRKSL